MTYLRRASLWGVCIALIALFSVSTGLAQFTRNGGSPTVVATRPAHNETNVCRNISITADISVPAVDGNGVDPTTLNIDTVYLIDTRTSTKVPATYNTTGGNDAFTITPNAFLGDRNVAVTYHLFVTTGLKDLEGNSFVVNPYPIVFTTGTSYCDVTDERFVRDSSIFPANREGKYASLAIGPDYRLYATMTLGEPGGYIRIFDIAPNGALQYDRDLNFFIGMAVVGIVVDPASTYHPQINPSGNIILWVSVNNPLEYPDHPQSLPFSGKIYKLVGNNINGTENWTSQLMITGLPRARKDHMVNSLRFGPDGKLYVNVGSMSAMGSADDGWKRQIETLLSGAVLQIDLNLLAQKSLPLNVATGRNMADVDNPATTNVNEMLQVDPVINYGWNDNIPAPYYNPQAVDAPLKIYATGVRNAFDLLWHSNGWLYLPTNGSGPGGNAPRYQYNKACDSRVNGQPYVVPNPTPPFTGNIEVQRDFLFRVEQGGYYGHPNPKRCEWVLNGGNPTAAQDVGQIDKYPVGVKPDVNWRGFIYDFRQNASANGVLEYKSNIYRGKFRNNLMVVRYSNGKDVVVLRLDPNGNVLPGNDRNPNDGDAILGVEDGSGNLTILYSPLDIVEDPRNGNLYVTEYINEYTSVDGQIVMLRPKNPNAAPIAQNDTATTNQGITLTQGAPGVLANDSDLNNNPMQAILVTNTTNGTLTLNSDGSFTYVPNAGFVGSDSFTYLARDNAGDDDGRAATVTINVLPDGVSPTATPTGTQPPVEPATSTPNPLTPTSTVTPPITPTATSTSIVNLVTNGSFESKNKKGEPKLGPWKLRQTTGDKIKCNNLNKVFSFESGCAMQLKGVAGENNRLQQNLDVAAVAAGNMLTLEFAAKGKKINPDLAFARLTVRYANSKDKVEVQLPAGDFDYRVFSGNLVMTDAPAKLKLQFRYRNTSGKLFLDAVVVLVSVAPTLDGEVMPLPGN